MNRLERIGEPEVALRVAFHGLRADIWTAIPGIIQSFDPDEMTCRVQPAIKANVRQKDGAVVSVALPLLGDCPVQFPSGGNCSLTFPVSPGDECLVVFSSRCIDAWWQSGGVQEQAEQRMHDLSDGFVLLGFRSKPRALPNVSTTATQLRSESGTTYIEMNPTLQKVKIVAPGGFDVVAPLSTFSAAVTITGLLTFVGGLVGSAVSGAAAVFNGVLNVIGQITANGKRVDDTHTHNGVQPGSGSSGNVN
ncbi:Gp138 family membrane-puncturing spike protein [Cupriavidus sp. SZY C1]|uniref:Gp138 family membrane-puncturing spike protein n=1 Tax=Cupriavidus sp. SZY C1 TaxID=3055037 RepID=UPI0028B5F71A|nr:Gp138 family membrane-puncturing spike protein [Cupriavidus sp. SZY C1]MDT6962901.1 Gp138 family membrane-puncturing spike protein [Cupriavidus sp. SZY C1]